MSHNQNVQNYFNGKAKSYDDVDKQFYWVFSDLFYKEVLKKELKHFIKERQEIKLLDAGAGTGRWSENFYDLFNKDCHISGTLIDISKEMLNVAKKKYIKKGLNKYFNFIYGNIEEMNKIKDNSYDLSISFYNVISFVEHPEKALVEIKKKLKKNGLHIAVVGNTYHALYFSLLTGRTEQLKNVTLNSQIKFNDQMPDMKVFTPFEIKKLYKKSGFSNIKIIGGPNFLYPGMEETFVHGASDNLQKLLENNQTMKELLDIELKHYNDPNISGRANTLLVIAKN